MRREYSDFDRKVNKYREAYASVFRYALAELNDGSDFWKYGELTIAKQMFDMEFADDERQPVIDGVADGLLALGYLSHPDNITHIWIDKEES